MNQQDPLKPQPGDWEAALAAIEASEVRFDRLSRWKRWGGGAGLTVTVLAAAWIALSVPANEEAFDSVSTEAEVQKVKGEAEVVATAPTSVSGDQETREAHVFEHDERVDVRAYPAGDEIQDVARGKVTQEKAAASPIQESKALYSEANADRMPFEPEEENGGLSAQTALKFDSNDPVIEYREQGLTGQDADHAVELMPGLKHEGLSSLRSLQAALSGVQVVPEFQKVVPSAPTEEVPVDRVRLFVAYEQSSAIVGWSINPWEDRRFGEWEMAANGSVVWDGRSRSWVALPETDAFGADRAAKGISSHRGLWLAAGLTASRAISPLWEGVLELDAQGLITREMTPTSMLAGEFMVGTAPPVWGTLEEESRLRVRWGVGAEWSVNEFNALRITLGGYAGATPAPSYLDFTTGKPVSLGEVRVTWSWK